MMHSSAIMNGFVVENADPDKLGRVRVSFYMPGSSEAKTEWARLALPYASKEAGFHFIPEKDDEVLITFVNGDADQPVVLGSLFSETHRMPDYPYAGSHNQDEKNSLRSLKTKSGLEITLSDDTENAFIRLRDEASFDLRLSRTDKKALLTDQSGNAISIDSESSRLVITDKAGNQLSIQDGKVEIEAAQRITFGAGGSHAIPLGDLLLQLFNQHIHNTGVGPSSPPVQPMTQQHLSQLTYTK